MSFWENLGNTLSEGSAGIFQKIKDETDAVSLRAENAAAERKIRESCETIGRLLTEGSLAILKDSEIEEVLAQDPAPVYKDITLMHWKEICLQVRIIREQKRVIANNESRIKDLTGVTVCPGCGKMVSKNSSFCPDCGMKLERPDVPAPNDEIMDGEYVQTDPPASAKEEKPEKDSPEAAAPAAEPEKAAPEADAPKTEDME